MTLTDKCIKDAKPKETVYRLRDINVVCRGFGVAIAPKGTKTFFLSYTAINGLSHIEWTGVPTVPGAHARNAVLYGEKAIDRSPCGTGTSARMAQLAAKGKLKVGDEFHHESIIGSIFNGRVEAAATVAGRSAIIPSIADWARMTGYNTIFVDDRDHFAHGFVVK